jgi:hypothetical protein
MPLAKPSSTKSFWRIPTSEWIGGNNSVKFVLAFFIFSSASWAINFGEFPAQPPKAAKQSPEQICANHLLALLPALLETEARVGISSLKGLGALLLRSGLTPQQAISTGEHLEAMVVDAAAPAMLRAAGKAAFEVWNQQQLLGVCVLASRCPTDSTGARESVHAGFPAVMTPFFVGGSSGPSGEILQAAASKKFDPADFWQGIVFQPFLAEAGKQKLTLMHNLQALAHDLGYFEARTRLANWVVRIQNGEKPDPRLRPYIAGNGKVIDRGLWDLVGQLRAVRTGFEAAEWFLGRASGDRERAATLARKMADDYIPEALAKLRLDAPHLERALSDFDVTVDTFWDKAQELGDLLEKAP